MKNMNQRVDKISIPEVITRFIAYQEKPGNEAWGSLHVVLEDHNVDNGHVQSCIEKAQTNGDSDGLELAKILLLMSKSQRGRLNRIVRETKQRDQTIIKDNKQNNNGGL